MHISILEVNISILEVHISILEVHICILEVHISILEVHISILEVNISILEVHGWVYKPMYRFIGTFTLQAYFSTLCAKFSVDVAESKIAKDDHRYQ